METVTNEARTSQGLGRMDQPFRFDWRSFGEPQDILQPAYGRKGNAGTEERCPKTSGRTARPREHCAADQHGGVGGIRDPVAEGQTACALASQTQPPAPGKPTKAAKLKVKTGNRDFLNMAVSGRGTKTSNNIFKSISRVQV